MLAKHVACLSVHLLTWEYCHRSLQRGEKVLRLVSLKLHFIERHILSVIVTVDLPVVRFNR